MNMMSLEKVDHPQPSAFTRRRHHCKHYEQIEEIMQMYNRHENAPLISEVKDVKLSSILLQNSKANEKITQYFRVP